ncbi:tetratricopeptide repeat protein [Niastella caeni]|uniref:Tetratricopeptide repeat protein n=1 Tax=Niastella caeni TaxID=2569763 RepID=A0A4S8HM96_9BACT|nr:tetratricopeptide repeat protein [Niastella caeni]THU34914.1 tetratricopeptide repeat protein [Niastella caeni]
MKTRIAFALIGLLIAFTSSAQPHRLANYRQLLNEKEKIKGFEKDTAYINLLAKFSTCFYEINPDSLLFYTQKVHRYANNIHYEKGVLESFCSMGYYYSLTGNYAQSLSYYQQALALAEKINDKEVELNMLRNIGMYYLNTGKEAAASQHFNKAYKIATDINHTVAKAYLLVDKAAIPLLHHQHDQALALYREALRVINDPDGFVAAFVRVDIGNVLCEKKQYQEAIPLFRTSLGYYLRTHDNLGRMNTMVALAKAYRGLEQTDTAISYAMTSLSLAKEIKHKEGIKSGSECLADLYEKKGDYRNSLTYFKLYKVYSDSIFNDDTRKKTADLEAKFIYEKKEALLKQKQANQVRILHFQIVIVFISALLMGVLIIFFLFPRWLRQLPYFRDLPPQEKYEEKKLTYL